MSNSLSIGAYMRTALLLFSLATLLTRGTPAQPNASPKRGRQDPTVTSQQIEKLPVRRARPRITFQRALKIAESYRKRKGINLTSYFLVEGRMMIQSNNDNKIKEPHWYFRWVNQEASIPDVEIIVSLRGMAERLSSK